MDPIKQENVLQIISHSTAKIDENNNTIDAKPVCSETLKIFWKNKDLEKKWKHKKEKNLIYPRKRYFFNWSS